MNSVMELAAAALTTLLQLAALYFFARQFQQTDRRGRVALGLIVVLIVLLRAGSF